MAAVSLAYDVYETDQTIQDKSPIILLHGFYWNKYMLREIASELCNETGRKVFCVDLRCHDQSPFTEECNIHLMAEDIKLFIKERELNQVSFVCQSFSSSIAFLVLLDQPEVVDKIVMVDHPPFNSVIESSFKEFVQEEFLAQNRFLNTLDSKLSLAEAKRKILTLSEGAKDAQKAFLQKVSYELIKVNNKFDWKTNHKFLLEKYLSGNFLIPPKEYSGHDILMIKGKDSAQNIDQEIKDLIETIKEYVPHGKYIFINKATHLLMFEKPDEFIEAVSDFLK